MIRIGFFSSSKTKNKYQTLKKNQMKG